MTDGDVDRIEAELSVKLPAAYRHLLTHFPIRFDRGKANGPLWDDADALIRRNAELRTERRSLGVTSRAVPTDYFFVGDDGGGWQHLLDLRTEPPIVCTMEFEDVATIAPELDDAKRPLPLNRWYHDFLTGLRDEGVDLDSPTDPYRSGSWGCVAFAIAAAVVVAFAVVGVLGLFRR